MEMVFLRHVLSLRMILRCFHDNLSGPGVDELLHLVKELMNSSSAKYVQIKDKNDLNSSRTLQSMMRSWVVLKVKCNACQRLSSSRHGWPLNLIAFGMGSFCLLTQFMSSHSPFLWLAIFLILRSKNVLCNDLKLELRLQLRQRLEKR